MLRFGLCCKFAGQDIKFYSTTAKHIATLTDTQRMLKLSNLCLENSISLMQALEFCNNNKIGCFRVNSKILPLKTHPQFAYDIKSIPESKQIITNFALCADFAKKNNIRLSFHPDQFILLSSEKLDITTRSIQELDYQAELSEIIGADIINIHGGGGYGNKKSALARVSNALARLSLAVREKLSFENDDRVYSPADLLPFCEENNIPFVYDVHHHRCLSDDLSIEQVTERALATWNREPLFHLSSPKNGWAEKKTNLHADYIDINDFPGCWKSLDITIEIEAKAKEMAIAKLIKDLS